MQKQIRKITKVLSILLCTVLMIGLVPASVFASNETNASQIGNYFEVDDKTGALESSPTLTEGSTEQSYADGKVKVNKTISATNEENVFDITLSVSTQEKIEEGSSSPDAATVLVIDVSGSMNSSRMNSAKKAAQTFINSFAAEDANRKIAIVKFSGSAQRGNKDGANTVQAWTNASELKTTSNNILCDPINNLSAGGATCTEAGVMLGKNLLNEELASNSAIQGIENKNIILLTDGKPTLGVTDSAESKYESETSIICPQNSNGNSADTDGQGTGTTCATHEDVETLTDELKKSGYGTYAIYVGNESVNCSRCDLNKSGSEWLAEDCGFTTYSASDDDLDELVKIFEKIVELIQMKAQAWIVTDPMGENIDFQNFVTTSSLENEFTTDDEGTITWDLKNSPRGTSDTDSATNITTTTYTLTYRVKLDTLAAGYTAGDYYPTNGVTELTYLVTETNNNQTEYTEGTAYFNIPSVKGYDGDFSFKKVDEEGNPLTNATFTLTKDNWTVTATSDENGNVTINNIPSGHTFTLTETQAPEGYELSETSYNVTVSYGDVSVQGVTAGTEFEFPNVSTKTSIPVTKIWDDGDNQDNIRPDEITVQLYANGEKVTGKTLVLNETNSWSGSFTDIPAYKAGQKVTYTVQETAVPDGYTAEVSGNAADGFTITNTHIPDKALTIQKIVDGNMGDKNREFEFTLSLTKDDEAYTADIRKITGDSETKVSANEDGKYTFTLKHNESIQLKIPHGCEYTITEATVFGYETKVQIDDGTAENTNEVTDILDNDSKVIFTNTKDTLIPTGVVTTILPFALMILLAGSAAAFFFVKRRRSL